MKKLLTVFILVFFCNFTKADFKDIKKKAEIKNPEIIFSIPKKLNRCQTKLYVDPELNIVRPLLKVKAPSGYGLDDRYDYALSRFTNFSFPCSGGNIDIQAIASGGDTSNYNYNFAWTNENNFFIGVRFIIILKLLK